MAPPPPPGNCPASGYEFDTAGNGQWAANKQFTATNLDANFYCAVNFPSKLAPTSAVPANNPAIAAANYSVTSDAATTADCQLINGNDNWQTAAPTPFPACTHNGNPNPNQCSCGTGSMGGAGGCTRSCTNGGSPSSCSFTGGSMSWTCNCITGAAVSCSGGV